MAFETNLAILLLALAVEAAVGYPARLYAAVGHPVTWMGALIARLDGALNDPADSFTRRRLAGVAALVVLLLATTAITAALTAVLNSAGWIGTFILLPVVASSLLAQRSLHEHVARVRDDLRSGGLAGGREAVSMIVGRNPAYLDEAGVCRAAIESLAENFSDGITAPAFWTAVLGLPGGAVYKAVNTADSMIGHKTERHHAFGWASARLDDLVNLPASRLTALLVVLAALGPSTSAAGAARAVWRDASRHRSPNAGWPEAAFAGALGLSLAGPRVYGETRIEDHTMGDGRREATADDIDRALRLYRRSLVLLFAVFALPLAVSLALR
nr:adenosylcobinamide-phosphate synthase CbiB [Chthonobacter albigriseus]